MSAFFIYEFELLDLNCDVASSGAFIQPKHVTDPSSYKGPCTTSVWAMKMVLRRARAFVFVVGATTKYDLMLARPSNCDCMRMTRF